jgi:TolB-like protein/Tfp pilus assembly protein PilF
MGEVYRARDHKLGRDVAIKILPTAFTVDGARASLFEREARMLAALNHPNILAVYDVGVDGGTPYVVSELLDGQTLDAAHGARPIPLHRLLDLAIQIATGLNSAHRRGIVHCDIKPSNLFLTSDGQVKILDFGIAKLLTDKAVAPALGQIPNTAETTTHTGSIIGTPAYMSPEQARGAEIDSRSDVFSLGLVLYGMATGVLPTALSQASVATIFPPPSSHVRALPSALDAIVLRSLHPDPAERYQRMWDLLVDLKSVKRSHELYEAHRAGYAGDRPVAVLPLRDLNANRDNAFFAEGLADELINALTNVRGLAVASRAASFRFPSDADPATVGRELGVEAVLQGSIACAGERLRVIAELVDTSTGLQMWSGRYDRSIGDVFLVQEEVAQAIVSQLRLSLGDAESPLMRRYTASADAYQWYLKGRYHWEHRRRGFVQHAIQAFQQAIAIDPTYAPAHAGLALCYCVVALYGLRRPKDMYEDALVSVDHAIAADDQLAEAHFARAFFKFWLEWEFPGALAAIQRAIELGPLSGSAHAYYGLFLVCLGRLEEACAEASRAVARDPLSPLRSYGAAVTFHWARQDDRAIEECRRTLELDPEHTLVRVVLARALSERGRHEEAIAVATEAVDKSGGQVFLLSYLGTVQARAGNFTAARTILDELSDRTQREYVAPLHFADLYAALDDRAEALKWLGRAFAERNGFLATIRVNRLYDNLRGEPAFVHLIGQLRL